MEDDAETVDLIRKDAESSHTLEESSNDGRETVDKLTEQSSQVHQESVGVHYSCSFIEFGSDKKDRSQRKEQSHDLHLRECFSSEEETESFKCNNIALFSNDRF